MGLGRSGFFIYPTEQRKNNKCVKTGHKKCCSALCLYQSEQDLTSCTVKWKMQRVCGLWENMRMISSEYNNDKCSEHDALAIISILFKEIQRGYSNIVCWVNVCWGTNVKPAHTHARYLDLKLVGSGFMVSCYSIILLSRALVRAVLGRVRWYTMCHCSPNPIFSSPLSEALCFCCPCMIQPPGENIAHPLFSVTQPCAELRKNSSVFRFLINIPLRVTAKIINLISPHIARHFINHC